MSTILYSLHFGEEIRKQSMCQRAKTSNTFDWFEFVYDLMKIQLGLIDVLEVALVQEKQSVWANGKFFQCYVRPSLDES